MTTEGLLTLVKSIGYTGVFGIIFAESGIVFCFFLPGDSLLFTTGFLASQNYLNIWMLCIGAFLAAFFGNLLGYEFGRRVGLKIFSKGDTRFLKLKHLRMTETFFMQHGAMAVILARFLPIIRTFTPFLAGMARMPFNTFVRHSAIGALLWAVGLPVLGFFFGKLIPPDHIDTYLLPIIVLIIVVSMIPSVLHMRKMRHDHNDRN